MQLYTKILIGMLVGIVFGLAVGPNSTLLPQDGIKLNKAAKVVTAPNGDVQVSMATGLRTARAIAQDGEWTQVEWTVDANHLLRLKAAGVQEAMDKDVARTHTGWVLEQAPQVERFAPIGQTLVDSTEWIGRLFLAMIKMVVVPLVFFSLVVGIASLGDVRKLGRMGGRTLGFFMFTTVMALIIGVGLANLIKPGKMLSQEASQRLLSSFEGEASSKVVNAAEAPSFADQILSLIHISEPTRPY